MQKYLAASVALAVLLLAGTAFANQDNPNGFRPFAKAQAVNYQVAASQTIKIGDAVTLNTAGYVIIAAATSARILGVAASGVTSSAAGDGIAVYDDPAQVFIGQCSGTISRTDVDDTPLLCDIEGTVGIMEVNENAASYRVVQVFAIVPGETWGSANARVFFRFAQHLNSGNPAVAGVLAGAVTLDSLDVLGNVSYAGWKLLQTLTVGGGYGYTQTVPGTYDWAITNAATLTLPASIGPSVAVYPISGLKQGDVVQAFTCLGAVDSAGNAVNLTIDLRRTTKNAGAAMTDASVSSFALPAKTAPYALEDGNAAIAHVVADDYIYYFRLTGTTTAATGIDVGGCELLVDRK